MNIYEHKDSSLYKVTLLQNLLNRRLMEKAEGVKTCRQRRQEMRLILFREKSNVCENAPWSTGSGGMDEDNQDGEDVSCDDVEMGGIMKTESNHGRAPLRIRLVLKRKADEDDDEGEKDTDLSVMKRRCASDRGSFSPSPTPSSTIVV